MPALQFQNSFVQENSFFLHIKFVSDVLHRLHFEIFNLKESLSRLKAGEKRKLYAIRIKQTKFAKQGRRKVYPQGKQWFHITQRALYTIIIPPCVLRKLHILSRDSRENVRFSCAFDFQQVSQDRLLYIAFFSTLYFVYFSIYCSVVHGLRSRTFG